MSAVADGIVGRRQDHINPDKWQFNHQQMTILKQYYDGNKLLVDCLNSDCYITRSVHDEIEESLLVPISEIEQR